MTVQRPYLTAIASAALLLLSAAAMLSGAAAQPAETEAATPGAEQPAAGEGGEGETAATAAGETARPSNAPFMKPLGRLSMILGSVHFLRTLCGDDNAGIYRQKMSELIEAQSPNEFDRRVLIANFNGGYRAFESTYRECTPAAQVAASRYIEEGATLAREISARYGN